MPPLYRKHSVVVSVTHSLCKPLEPHNLPADWEGIEGDKIEWQRVNSKQLGASYMVDCPRARRIRYRKAFCEDTRMYSPLAALAMHCSEAKYSLLETVYPLRAGLQCW